MAEQDKQPQRELTVRLRPQVDSAVQKWQRWVAQQWTPNRQRTRKTVCRKCFGSPIVQAAGLASDVPHQVTHALVLRIHKLIDAEVDAFTRAELPLLTRELDYETMWHSRGFDPQANAPVEVAGLHPDPLPDSPDQPFLFTLEEFSGAGADTNILPPPPLTAEEKAAIRAEIERADQVAFEAGQTVCFILAEHRPEITQTVARFVEPQIQKMLDELTADLFR